ncbi:DNA internalization-related competence protein ComEC/Rec2 [Oceanobacillus halophilus]|uniref:DNA internalization-related competence protein ComEC/Rec2 n=1 Tax=Oceanobacillus halophilus TaxID=930130 RepID=A0A495AGX7_9BACI|nr:DNA internalization-related competence protein ComEC/Rec2 [Oceanobacillus halophilus]RKQ37845.1 DNA internalization-related competence protein ComEC/Rec2 [Oceanobacillus halophilus]
MKGHWHIVALSVICVVITIQFNTYIIAIIYFLWLFYLYYTMRLRKLPIVVSLIFLLIFLFHIPKIGDLSLEKLQSAETEYIYGTITSAISSSNKKLEFTLQEKSSNTKILIVYFPQIANEDTKDIKYGATCMIEGKKEIPERSRNPGQFDYQSYLLKKGISSQVVIDSLDNISCKGSSVFNNFFAVRSNLISEVENNISTYTASWLTSLVLGDDSGLSEETVQLFRRWGLTHIIAISGTHIALLLAFLYFILIKLSILTREKAQWLVILILPIYAVLAGGEPSVWRASIMVMIIIFLSKGKFRFSITDVLSIVFILFIYLNPYLIYHVGFQFSFLVTFGIFLSKTWIASTRHVLFQSLQISFIAQMIILPFQFTYFSMMQPLSILLNVLIIPYFSLLVIPFMYVMLPLTLLSIPMLSVFDRLFINLNELVLTLVRWLDNTVNYPWIFGTFTLEMAIFYYVLLFLLMVEAQQNKLKHAFLYGVSICVFLVLIAVRPYVSPVGTVTMLDIGQGDAYVIELPYRKGVFMIDAGARVSFEDGQANENVYQQIIKPYLYSRGIHRIDALFLTHEDSDHVGSAPFIVEDMEVKEIFLPAFYTITEEEAQLWNRKNVNVNKVAAKQTIHVNDYSFFVMGPIKDANDTNENSLVLLTEIGSLKWLFTGDIGKDIEKELIKTYPNLDIDVLKVAHHGSNTSSEKVFLQKVKPQFALISVGQNNRYGHPAEEVISRLNEQKSMILRTDIHGAVQFRFDKNSGTFFTYFP